jgi:type II secretory pathway pseudopilin PulG
MNLTSQEFLRPRGSSRSAFTLIELLVVIGLIVLLVGGIGIALRGGDKSAALQSAQGSLASALSLARAQAALKGADAALAVNADSSDSERYLRYYVVVVKNSSVTPPIWEVTGDGEYLPAGVYFLPKPTPTGAALNGDVDFDGMESAGFDGEVAQDISGLGSRWLMIGISSLGHRVNATGSGAAAAGSIMLSTGDVQPPDSSPPFKYNNAFNVRGFFISQYGVGALINNRDEFNAYSSN